MHKVLKFTYYSSAASLLSGLEQIKILPTFGPGIRQYKPTDFDPKINRHTGKPHEHKREIARRLRQKASH